MYTQTWNKYLPVIRILLKRALNEDQKLQLNISDFQKTATVRKTGHKFTLEFSDGKSANIGLPEIAKDLSTVLLLDPVTREILKENEYSISFDTKYQLSFKRVAVLAPEPETADL